LTDVITTVLDQPAKLGKILLGMNRALGDIPLTLKVRTGVKDGRNTAHRLMPRIGSEWGAGAITVSTLTPQDAVTMFEIQFAIDPRPYTPTTVY
jgi:tRNA-dihydrouridine synthase 3